MTRRKINADSFIKQFIQCTPSEEIEKIKAGAGAWTDLMCRWIHKTSTRLGLGMCCEKMNSKEELSNWQDGQRKEFLFDITLFHDTDWKNPMAQPAVIIEHENYWHENAFLDDFWKLQVGYAPLRIMFGYNRNQNGVKKYIDTVNTKMKKWSFPQDTEDLIFLGYEGMGDTFLVYKREKSTWKEHRLLSANRG